MNDDRKNSLADLADFANDIFDANKDGRVSLGEVFGWISRHAVELVLLMVDLVMLVAEYRVYDFGLTATGSVLKALGFVALSGLPFYLGQVMFTYPLANGFQQLIAAIFVVGGLFMSATFGFADLTRIYDVLAISKIVAWFTGGYILFMLLYVLSDARIRDQRLVAQTKATARYGTEQIRASNDVLAVVENALHVQTQVVDRFGDKAVKNMLERFKRGKNKNLLPEPIPVPHPSGNGSKPAPPRPPQKTYDYYSLERLLRELGVSQEEFTRLANSKGVDDVYRALQPGIQAIEISHKNFKALVRQVQDGHPNPR